MEISKTILILIVLIYSFLTQSFAQSSPISYCQTHEERIKELDWIEKYYRRFNALVPNPTPTELAWIETEEKEIGETGEGTVNKKRKYNLITSQAYIQREVKETLNKGLEIISKIRTTTDTNLEMAYWAELAEVTMDKNFSDHMKTLEVGTTYLETELFFYEGKNILSSIVIPFLLNCKAISPKYYQLTN